MAKKRSTIDKWLSPAIRRSSYTVQLIDTNMESSGIQEDIIPMYKQDKNHWVCVSMITNSEGGVSLKRSLRKSDVGKYAIKNKKYRPPETPIVLSIISDMKKKQPNSRLRVSGGYCFMDDYMPPLMSIKDFVGDRYGQIAIVNPSTNKRFIPGLVSTIHGDIIVGYQYCTCDGDAERHYLFDVMPKKARWYSTTAGVPTLDAGLCKEIGINTTVFDAEDGIKARYDQRIIDNREAKNKRKYDEDMKRFFIGGKQYRDYAHYLVSPHWQSRRAKWYSEYYQICGYCGNNADRPQLHHTTYKHLGDEPDDELICLCLKCHEYIHTINWHHRPELKRYRRIPGGVDINMC